MSTIPPERTPLSRGEPHQHRQVAESFGADAERYDRARPSYPQAMVDRIIAESPGPDVLEVGCGTGIVARQFQAAGGRVLGVDVDARMADLARRSGLEVEVAKFEGWDPAGRAFDAVVSGQTWHWIDPIAGAAKAAQALRPGGRLAVFWNVFQPPPEVAEGFSVVYHRVLPELRFDWEPSYTRDEWLDQVPTHGGHSPLPPAKLETLLAGIAAAIDAVRAASRCATPRWWSPRCEPMAPDTTLRSIYPVPAGRRGPTAPWRDAGPAAGCSLRSGTPGAATPRPPRPAGRAPGGRRASGTSPGRRP